MRLGTKIKILQSGILPPILSLGQVVLGKVPFQIGKKYENIYIMKFWG